MLHLYQKYHFYGNELVKKLESNRQNFNFQLTIANKSGLGNGRIYDSEKSGQNTNYKFLIKPSEILEFR